MASLEEIRDVRLKKLEALRAQGINPYPAETQITHTIAETLEQFEVLSADKTSVTCAGRIVSFRPQGALIFFHFTDGSFADELGTAAKIQVLLKKPAEDGAAVDFNLFSETVDVGDFVEITGTLFMTKRNERSIEATSWRMLAKSLRPLPEKWHGLQDVEERFRRRYLDTVMSDVVRQRFVLRSRLVTELRAILDKANYIEMETPALQPLYGGASAVPFVTHHEKLDMDLYLRISDELYLKRLLVGGFPKIYEIARDFRNEGIDATHNPEFTMLEFYEAYSDARRQMAFVEKMFKTIVKKLFKHVETSKGGTVITIDGNDIDFGESFTVVSYFDLFRRYALIPNPETITRDELVTIATQRGIAVDPADSVPKILDNIYKKVARPKLIQPTFIIGYPADYLPLAKRDATNPTQVEAFQLVINGLEIVKAFSELNDPIDQKNRMFDQEKNKHGGEDDAQRIDEDFIEALEYGCPPAGGVGIGIDRLAMLLTNVSHIKEVIFFPTMRPRGGGEKTTESL